MTATLPDVGKRKKQTDDAGDADRHQSGFMVRLPEAFRQQLRAVQNDHEREHRYRIPITVMVQQALEDYLRARGHWPPPDQADA